jgi:DNA adenine methylase
LEKEADISLHRWKQQRQARVIYENQDMFDRVKRAWAVWILANMSYGCKLNGCFGYDRDGTNTKKMANKRSGFTTDYAIRLQRVQIECRDALKIIKSRDVNEAFFYLDPPYVGADQGHYDGYTQEDFDTLLTVLKGIKGKFLLSSYRNKTLTEFSRENNWSTLELKISSSMTHGCKSQRNKVEVLTANYPISVKLDEGSKKRLVSREEGVEN